MSTRIINRKTQSRDDMWIVSATHYTSPGSIRSNAASIEVPKDNSERISCQDRFNDAASSSTSTPAKVACTLERDRHNLEKSQDRQKRYLMTGMPSATRLPEGDKTYDISRKVDRGIHLEQAGIIAEVPSHLNKYSLSQPDPTQESWDEDFEFNDNTDDGQEKTYGAFLHSPDLAVLDDSPLWGKELEDETDSDAEDEARETRTQSLHLKDSDSMPKSNSNSTLKAVSPRSKEGEGKGKSNENRRFASQDLLLSKERSRTFVHLQRDKLNLVSSSTSVIPAENSFKEASIKNLSIAKSKQREEGRHPGKMIRQSVEIRSTSDFSTGQLNTLSRHRANRSVSEEIFGGSNVSSTRLQTPRSKGDYPWSELFSSRGTQQNSSARKQLEKEELAFDNHRGSYSNAISGAKSSSRGAEDVKRSSHQKGRTSLSLSLGFSNPWGRSNKINKVLRDEQEEVLTHRSSMSPSTKRHDVISKHPKLESHRTDVKGIAINQGISCTIPKMNRSLSGQINNTNDAIRIDHDNGRRSNDHASRSLTRILAAPTSGDEGQSISQGSANSTKTSGRSHSGSTATSTSAVTLSDFSHGHRGSIGGTESISFSFSDNTSPLQEIRNRMPEDYSKMRKTASGGEVTTCAKENTTRSRNVNERGVSNSSSCKKFDQDKTEMHDLAFPNSNSRQRTAEMQARIPSDPCDKSTKDADLAPSIDQVARRNSLGDLKIPSRITRAQENIRNNISRVKEFAHGIEDLKILQRQYREEMAKSNITDRKRIEIEEEYGNWWECAEVLVDLGRGKGGEEEEVDITSLERGNSTMEMCNQSPSKIYNRKSMDLKKSVRREGDVRSTNSRASSSSRSVDPQREAEILSVMLTGAPINLNTPNSPSVPLQESKIVFTDYESSLGSEGAGKRKNPDKSKDKSNSELSSQSKSQDCPTSSGIITRANKPAIYYSHSPLTSPLVPRPKIYQQSSIPTAANHSMLAPAWTTSTESISTQGTFSRRARLRSAGRIGLQGLKELLRSLKVYPAVLQSSMDVPYQSKINLSRIATNDSRVTSDHLELPIACEKAIDTPTKKIYSRPEDEIEEGEEGLRSSKLINLIRSHSRFSKSKRQSRESQRDSIDGKDYTTLQERSNLQSKKPTRGNSASVNERFARISSGTKIYHADSSLDSDWTEADYEAASCIEMETHSDLNTPNAGKKRFLFFSQRSTSASIVERWNNQKVSFAGESSTEDEECGAIRRQSLQIPLAMKSEERKVSNGLRTRRLSDTKQSGHLNSGHVDAARSKSEDVIVPAFESPPKYSLGRRAVNRPSVSSTMISSGGNESNTSSSGTQTESKTSRRTNSGQDHTIVANSRRRASSTSSTPPRAIRSIQAGKYKKLILQADAIPSLLVYVEATKERCQECIELLHLDVPSGLLLPE